MPNTIENAVDNTIQSDVRNPTSRSFFNLGFLSFLGKANDLIAPWWSTVRDAQLRAFWKRSDHLSGAMYNFISKLTTIPIKVVARDKSIKTHVRIADEYTRILQESAQFGEGWVAFFSKWLEDLLDQDNGAFAEVIGEGRKDGPITGLPISIAHLDAANCMRTGDPLYPVIYTNSDGRAYKLHYTRVMYASQLPSAQADMFGVGMCAIGRAVNAAQNLIDISVYKQEKLGSRPNRQLIITQGGLDPEDLHDAILMAESTMTERGLTRFAKSIALGNRNIPNATLQSIDLASLPDGFDESESTTLGMAVVAMAFGMDARELWPATQSGATKADAIVSHIKQRGKGPGQTLRIMENLLNQKYLPPYLEASFDYQDDAQDRQQAEINNIRAQARERNLANGVTSKRIEREKMMDAGELTKEQFEELELADGRLIDGVEVDILFHSNDPFISGFLKGITDANWEEREIAIMEFIAGSRDAEKIRKARQSLAALEQKFEPEEPMPQPAGKAPPIDDSYQQERAGRKLPRPVVRIPDEEAVAQDEGA